MYAQPDWLLVGGQVIPTLVVRILSPQLGACESVTKISLASVALVSTSETPSVFGVKVCVVS